MENPGANKPAVSPFWTIWFPLIITLGVAAVLILFASISAASGSASIDSWAKIAAILLIVPAMFLGVIIFLILLVCIRGMRNLHPKVSPFLQKVSKGTSITRKSVHIISSVIVKPFEWIHKVNGFISRVLHSKRSESGN